ncbi:hypothetical protein WAI453_006348 [Rhynchosporium graminicola]
MVLKVLIVGGGVAGPSLAYWLSRLKADITIIERFPTIRAYGQQVDIRGQGVPIMKKMGIEAAIRAVVVHEPGTQLVDGKGKTTAFFPTTTTNTSQQSFSSEFEIMRGDLINTLYDLTKNKTNVHHIFDTSIKHFTQDKYDIPGGNFHVDFSDGRKEDFDLVIGADGTGSQVRKIMLGPDAKDPRYSLNAHIGFFTTPSAPGDSKNWTICPLPGRRAIMSRQDNPDLLRVYMMIYGKQPVLEAAYKSGNIGYLQNTWAELFDGYGWEAKRFVDGLKNSSLSDDLYATRMEEIRLPPGDWCRGRVILIGDAAHSQSINGQGVTLGMVGAYILAGEIAKLATKEGSALGEAVERGGKNYEERFRPMVAQTRGSSYVLGLFFPRTNFGIGVIHKIAGWAATRGYGLSGGTGVDGRVTWTVPEYQELRNLGD